MPLFSHLEVAPPDPILGINIAFNEDTNPDKVNLGVGAYRTDEGKPYVLEVVKKAEKIITSDYSKYNKEYLPIDGLPEFRSAAQKLLFGADSQALKEGRISTTQSISGTGALKIAAEFITQFLPGSSVLIPNPTWGNHDSIFKSLPIIKYRYFDPATNGLHFDGLCSDFKNAPNKSIVILHMCAHNPTGVDPTPDQWQKIAELCKEKEHIALFDSAYQGYASGDVDKDAYSLRLFMSLGFECLVAQSFAKNMGLYGERAGTFSVVCSDAAAAKAVASQLKLIVRPMYSNPPIHGARIAALVLNDPQLHKEWREELTMMSGRIINMRKALFDRLKEKKTPGDWSHIINQIGMFTYTGLSEKQVGVLIDKYHIHMMKNGRISMCGLNTHNVNYVADAIHSAVTSM